jgi:hypothetical protein
VQVKNKPFVVCIVIMRLISLKRSRGSETVVILALTDANSYTFNFNVHG